MGIEAVVPEAKVICEELRGRWEGFLSKQDRGFRAHYTVQNKVDEEEVIERTLEEVKAFEGSTGTVDGLSLYRYDKGYWRHERDFWFAKGE